MAKIRYIEKIVITRSIVGCFVQRSAGLCSIIAARLRSPMKRVGPRGSGQFEEIGWDEAMEIATGWLAPIRISDPKKLAFFTGRDQSQALTGWWAQQFGTPNFAAHGGFCSVNMAAGGIYTIGGAFWEFGSPDWDLTELFVLFGVAEDHDSNPIKIGLGQLKTRGKRVISVNPVQTGYAAISDDWYSVTPGTDGLLILSLIRELMLSGNIDISYLRRYTNAPWLVIRNPGAADDGLFWRDDSDTPQIIDSKTGKPVAHDTKSAKAALKGEIKLPNGSVAVPAFVLMAEAYLDDAYDPDAIADTVGISADRIRQLAVDLAEAAFAREVVINQPWTDWKGERHEKMIGRPVSMHAMRGISAHSNGFRHAGRCMCCNLSWDQSRHRGFSLQAALPKTTRSASETSRPSRSGGPRSGDGRCTAWICVGAGRFDHLPRWYPATGLTRLIAGTPRCRRMG